MSRGAWLWGGALLVVGVAILGTDLHAIVNFRPPAGSPASATLGQVVAAIVGGGLFILGGLVLGTGLRRRFQARQRRRLLERLAAGDE